MLRRITLALLLMSVQCAHEGSRPFVAPTPALEVQARPDSDYAFIAGASAPPNAVADQVGIATWYGKAFAGRKTASGERFDPSAMTAAHRRLPFGTWVEVRRVDTGSSIRVRITDRGPWGDASRVIDLSKAAADRIGLTRDGTAKVELRIVRGPE